MGGQTLGFSKFFIGHLKLIKTPYLFEKLDQGV
jgi:hypothetical protein